MKVLYFIGMPIPKVSEFLGNKKTYFGGWLTTTIDNLSKHPDIELTVLCPYKGNIIKEVEVDMVKYYFIPKKGNNDIDKKLLQESLNIIKPDISHMEGTEFKHHRTFIATCKTPLVVSLQGILNSYYPYINGGLIPSKLILSFNLQKMILGISLFMRKIKFLKRMKIEKRILNLSQNFLGRTVWDKGHSKYYNSTAKYFNAPRILRAPFYSTFWDINKIEKYTIFIGNSNKPLKGAHIVFESLIILKKKYPNIKVYVAGLSPYKKNKFKHIFINAYSNYLKTYIKKNNLKDNIIFLGELSEAQVADYLAKCNVYCQASSIENSPNSLAEAMAVGTPSVSSYVGGVSSMAVDNEEVLFYRFGDVAVLSELIKNIFDNDSLAISLSMKGRKRALINHTPERVIENLYNCYKEIYNKS
jgi:glycosyltransferase involved in cell wall biosynthesis